MLDDLIEKHGDLWSNCFWGLRCGEEFGPLIDETLTKLRRILPAARVTVVKEKFGRLVIYVEDRTDERVRELLRSVEVLSASSREIEPC